MKCSECNDGELIYSVEKENIICSNNITCGYEDWTENINDEFYMKFIKEACIERDELREFKELKGARDDGSKAFYNNKKEEDNPYKETYIKPEHIMKGVNDRLITDYDKIQLKLEREWHSGWVEESNKFKQDMEYKETLKKYNDVLEKYSNNLSEYRYNIVLLNKVADFLLDHNLKLKNLITCLPFFRRNIKKRLVRLKKEFVNDVREISKKDFPEK